MEEQGQPAEVKVQVLQGLEAVFLTRQISTEDPRAKQAMLENGLYAIYAPE